MTQPAKLQEPSMEEILASIRRIIADDEAKPSEVKPAAAEKPPTPEPPAKPEKPAAAAPAAKPPVMNDIPPSKIPAAQAAVSKAAPPPVAPPPAAPAASNSQDDIDAMLAGLDEATSEAEIRPAAPEAEVFELTDDMAVAPPEPPPQPSFHKIEPADDLEFTEAAAARTVHRTPAFEPSPFETPAAPPQQQILSHSTVSAVESAFNSLAHTVLSNNARTLEDLVKEMLRPMLKSWLDDNLPGLVERIVKAEIERVSRGR
jgi:cell pole-organizing protein PopZ